MQLYMLSLSITAVGSCNKTAWLTYLYLVSRRFQILFVSFCTGREDYRGGTDCAKWGYFWRREQNCRGNFFFSIAKKYLNLCVYACMSVLNLVSKKKKPPEFLSNRFYLPVIYKGYYGRKDVKDTWLPVKFFYLHAGV